MRKVSNVLVWVAWILVVGLFSKWVSYGDRLPFPWPLLGILASTLCLVAYVIRRRAED